MHLRIFLKFPPTINNYYLPSARGKIISRKGRIFREHIEKDIVEQGARLRLCEKLYVEVTLHPPDSRVRDLDNYMKALLDACTHAELWEDDVLIDQLMIFRGEPVKYGIAIMEITEAGPLIPFKKNSEKS